MKKKIVIAVIAPFQINNPKEFEEWTFIEKKIIFNILYILYLNYQYKGCRSKIYTIAH